jgi:dihydrolipoamide dehydrogenase
MSERECDVVILGAGPAGEVAAGRLAAGGLEVVIAEQELVGGECSYWACMPSKALLRPAQAVDEARRLPGAAEAVTGTVDAAAVLARRDEIVHDLDDASQLPWLESKGIGLVRGTAVIEGERRVRVGEDLLVARRAVIVATGSAAAMPPIDGLADAKPWGNREATTTKTIPDRLVVLGGGVVGVEMAQAFQSLGAQVTLLEGGPRVLSREEEFAAEQVGDALREAGVDLRTNVKATAVARDGDGGTVTVTLDDGGSVSGDELLVAVGRRLLTSDIGLGALGLEEGKAIPTDLHLCVPGHDWLYAIGDCNGRALLTHQGKYQGRIAADHILGHGNASIVYGGPLSPRVIFTEPQVAAVGYTLAAAQEAGLDVRCVDVGSGANAGGAFYGRNVAFTGVDVAEQIHAATIAIVGDVPLDRLWHAVPSFPTRSEVWLHLMEAYGL